MPNLPAPTLLQEGFPLAHLLPPMGRVPKPDYLTAEEYASLGLRCGLEVHQQLLTAGKLFCRCPARRYSEEHHAVVLRHMRPTLSELGEYDGTALMEFKTKKHIVYLLHRDSVCTYEMDDTPPFPMDRRALEIAVEIALLLRCQMVSEIHIARKQYLDGSIPTGFQRTSIVGVEGQVPFGHGVVRIIQLGLEEDACREVMDRGHYRFYRTDRLGMPLVETVTYPDLLTPWEAVWFGQLHRLLLRSTGKVRRGIGAARQDVNVSIQGGRRVEIKGVERIPLWAPLIHYEALRQRALLALREELHRRMAPSAWQAAFIPLERAQAASLVPTPWLDGRPLMAVVLRRFRGLLSWPLGKDRTFAHELADRVRVVACIDQRPNLVHSDDDPPRWRSLAQELGAGDEDAIVLLAGPPEDLGTACAEVRDRCLEAWVGVPAETRQVLPDGTTGFERILPGPDRMYPDTDLPPLALDPARIEATARSLPPAPWVVARQLHAAGLSAPVAGQLVRRRDGPVVTRVLLEQAADLSDHLVQAFLQMWEAGGNRDERAARRLLEAACAGAIPARAMRPLLPLVRRDPSRPVEELAREVGEGFVTVEEVREAVRREQGSPDEVFTRLMRRWGHRAHPAVVRGVLEEAARGG